MTTLLFSEIRWSLMYDIVHCLSTVYERATSISTIGHDNELNVCGLSRSTCTSYRKKQVN